MELRHLRYFVAVAAERNITRAAARLHVSQPPLSRQVRDLEEELGVTLLERGPRAVRLTAAGRVLFREARKVLDCADEAVRRTRAATGAAGGEIRVGYAPSPTVELLPRALRAFQKSAPGVRVVLLDLATDEMIAAVAARSLDLALLVRPPIRAWRKLAFEKLFEMPVGVIVPPRHRLARRRFITLDEALAEPLVAYIRRGYADYHHWLAGILKRSGRKPRMSAHADGAASLIAAVVSGQGIAFGPHTFTTVSGGRVRFIPLAPAAPPIAVGYLVRSGPLNPMVEEFIGALKSSAG